MDIDWDRLPNFTEDEIRCNCGVCGYAVMQPDFMYNIQTARTRSGVPYNLSSGCRCWEWNLHEGGASDSRHLWIPDQELSRGWPNAVDITWADWRNLYKILDGLFYAGLNRIKVYRDQPHVAGWVHVDGGGPGKTPELFMLG